MAQAARRLDRADQTIREISTDKIDTEIPAPASGRIIEILVQPGVTVDVGVTLARIATDADPNARATPPPAPRIAEAPPVTHVPARRPRPRRRPRRHRAAAVAPARARRGRARRGGAARRYSPGRAADRRRARRRPGRDDGTGRDGRVRKQDVLALVETHGRRAARRGAGPSRLHIESPYRPDPDGSNLARPATSRPRAGRCRGCADDRRADEALARHRGDVHDLDRGRHVAHRDRAQARSASPRCR